MKRLLNFVLMLAVVTMFGCEEANETGVSGGKDPLDVTSENLAGKWEAYKSYDSLTDEWMTNYGKSNELYYVLTMKESGTYSVSGHELGVTYSYSGVYTINKSILTLYISTSGEMKLMMEAHVDSLTGSDLVLREDVDGENYTLLYLHRK